jgi:hypothetical protein
MSDRVSGFSELLFHRLGGEGFGVFVADEPFFLGEPDQGAVDEQGRGGSRGCRAHSPRTTSGSCVRAGRVLTGVLPGRPWISP